MRKVGGSGVGSKGFDLLNFYKGIKKFDKRSKSIDKKIFELFYFVAECCRESLILGLKKDEYATISKLCFRSMVRR